MQRRSRLTDFIRFTSPAALSAALASVITLALAGTAAAQYPDHSRHSIRVHGGLFTPDGESSYWDTTALDFTGDPADFEDTTFAFDYQLKLGSRSALLFTGSSWEGDDTREYLDFVDSFGAPIQHRATLELDSVTAAYVLYLTGPSSTVRPYVGVGGGIYSWTLTEDGDFIDFFPAQPELFSAILQSEGEALGGFAMVGVDFRVGYGWSVFGEGRWSRVDDDLDGDFEEFGEIDLGGRSITAGVAFHF